MGELPRWVDVVLTVVMASLVTAVPAMLLARDHLSGRRDPGYRDDEYEYDTY